MSREQSLKAQARLYARTTPKPARQSGVRRSLRREPLLQNAAKAFNPSTERRSNRAERLPIAGPVCR